MGGKIDTLMNQAVKGDHIYEAYCSEHDKIWGGNEPLEVPQSLIDFINAHFRYIDHETLPTYEIYGPGEMV